MTRQAIAVGVVPMSLPRRDILRLAAAGGGALLAAGLPRVLRAEEDEKKKKKKSKIDSYARMLPDNYVFLPPYQVSNLINGRLQASRITLAIETKTDEGALALENKKREIDEVLYPLILELFQFGPPSGADLIVFKRRATDQLHAAFEMVENVYVRDIM